MNWLVSRQYSEIILLGAVAFAPAAFGAVEAWALGILSIMLCAAVFLSAKRNVRISLMSGSGALLLSVLAVIAIGAMQRLNPRSLLEPLSWLPRTVNASSTERALLFWATMAAAIWGVSTIFAGIHAIRRVLITIFVVGFALSAVGIIQQSHYHDQNPQWIYGLRSAVYPLNPFGPYYNRDHAASFLVMTFFCGVGLLLDRFHVFRSRTQRVDPATFASLQALILFGLAIILTGILVTRSRGAASALLATLLAFGLFVSWSNSKRIFLLIVGLAVSVLLIVKSPLASKVSVSLIREAASERMLFYQAGFAVLSDFPFLGAGLGAFQHAYYPYQSRVVLGVVEHVHCDWLELAIQIGIIGLAAFVALLLRYLIFCIKSLSAADMRPTWGLACGILAAVISFFLHGLVDFSFQTPANALVLFVLLSSLGVLARKKSMVPLGDEPEKQWNPFVAGGAIMLAVASAIPAISSWNALWGGDALDSRESNLRRVLKEEGRPRDRYEHARWLVEISSSGNSAVLREALVHSKAVVAADDANPRYRALNGKILWKLGRFSDGQAQVHGK